MSSPLTGPEAQFAIAALAVAPSEIDLAHLRTLGDDANDWDALAFASELHGVLPLVARNIELAGVALPEAAGARFAERAQALSSDALRDECTLELFLRAASKRKLTVVLLKGASVTRDLYPDPALRCQGDVDVLVPPSQAAPAVDAAAEAGLLMHESQLPLAWYRHTHFQVKLFPASELLRPLEIHWHLHHPALLLTTQIDRIAARTVPIEGLAAANLDPLDRTLHLATHLVSHAYGRSYGPGTLTRELAQAQPEVRLKWVLDLALQLEALAGRESPRALRERAQEWGAEGALATALDWIEPVASETALAFGSEAAGVTRAERADPEPSESAGSEGAERTYRNPTTALGFRTRSIAQWPRWIWPPRGYLRKRYHGTPALLARGVHAAKVLALSISAGVALPLALAGRRIDRTRRRAQWQSATSPERALDAVALWRRLQRAREHKSERTAEPH